MKDNLPLKTQLEMARGGLGHAVDQVEARKYVNTLGILADGERALRTLLSSDAHLYVTLAGDGKDKVRVTMRASRRTEPVDIYVPLEDFPDNTLKAQVMLVCG